MMSDSSMLIASRVAPCARVPADCVAGFIADERAFLIVADGAGNSAAGRLAAEFVVEFVRESVSANSFNAELPEAWAELIARCDQQIARSTHGGETTAIALSIARGIIVGASVGDSEAWLHSRDRTIVLTENQNRKPLLGTGRSQPRSFTHAFESGTLLAATDGLFKYAPRARVLALLEEADLDRAASELIDLPRLASGELPDDVGLVLFRART